MDFSRSLREGRIRKVNPDGKSCVDEPLLLLTKETFQVRRHRLRKKRAEDLGRRSIAEGDEVDLL